MLGVAAITATPALAQEKAGGTPPAAAPAISGEDLKAYVRARAADALGAADTAAAGYAIALADVPNDEMVALRAYRQGLAAGDYALASRASKTLVRAGIAPPDTAILDFAVALKARDEAGADAAVARMAKGPLEFMMPVLRGWLAFDRGQDPFAKIDAAAGGALGRRYALEHRALLLIATRRSESGLAALRGLIDGGVPDGEDLRIDGALLLAGTGDREAARELLTGSSAQMPGLHGKMAKGVKPSASFGAARLFLSLAADLAQEDAGPLSILLTRASLLLDPSDDRARLYLGEALSRAGSDRLALDILAEVRRDSPFSRGAAAGTVAALRRAGRTAEAIQRAKVMATDRDSTVPDVQTYADLLVADDRFDEAAAAYATAIKRQGTEDGWMLHFLRGTALDRGGHWDDAVVELRRAVQLAPNEVMALTYLGFALVEHRADLGEAQSLLERARRLKPADAAITDSLAWTYYLRGDTAKALPLLEEAARADPGGALVNEHLGDVYWKLGRRYEARYAWRAAAIYADAGDVPRIQAKVVDGLTAAK
jgi:Flp pilus assembly protein TadD